MALAGEYFICFRDSKQDPVAVKCRPIRLIDNHAILVKDSSGIDVSVLVDGMHLKDEYGIIGVDSNDVQVGLSFIQPTFIGICWIDEASPIYTKSQTRYLQDLNLFKTELNNIQKWTAACQVPGHPPEDVIYGNDYPINYDVPITIETIGRPPTTSELISRFNVLLHDFQALDPVNILYPDYLILTIDSSGSMSIRTIQPAYGEFKQYVYSTYPFIKIVERIFTNEGWLNIWTEQISDIV